MSPTTMLRVRDVALTFNPGRVNEAPALRKISLDVELVKKNG